ncbi:MAG: sulfotransferase [Phycisphaeraceae bacterium]|nr:sulfotransferase [Phycisphaeraceae bacterium]MCB9846967.1 sulfotransferase [Phycisphaeraceae bacterium]
MANHLRTNPTSAASAAEINRAMQLVDSGAYLQASTICAQLLKRYPKAPAIWGVLSAAQVGMADHAEARRSALKGLKLDPKSNELRIRLGLTYAAEHRFAEAEAEYRRALEQQPGRPWTLRCLATTLTRVGRDEEAYELLRPFVVDRPWNSGLAHAFLGVCVATRRFDEGLRLAETLLAETRIPTKSRTSVLFKLAECYAGAGQLDRAFEVYTLANECPGHVFDAAKNRRDVDLTIESWTADALARLGRPKRRTDRFVFIVGMPRSGTSLVEQIIASHPRAFGAGELDFINNIAVQLAGTADGWSYLTRLDRLTPEILDTGAQKYAEALHKLSPGAEIVTDKMPANARHLGLIAAMLPQAKVIHCVRDARDTCLSCYFHDFLGVGNIYTYDLANLGDYFADQWRLIKHWKRTLDIPILDVVYEELVSDQEAQSRRLIDFVGLGWDDRCIDFHKTRRTVKTVSADQVNKPMYRSSVARWKPYEKHLGPLLDRLPHDAFFEPDQ